MIMALAISGCRSRSVHDAGIRNILEQLDRTVADRDIHTQKKEARIAGMKSLLDENMADEERYKIYDRIYDEYYQYNLDSAIVYAKKKSALATHITPPGYRIDAAIDLAERYILSGVHVDAIRLLDSIDTASLDTAFLARYFHTRQSLYEDMAGTADDPELKLEYDGMRKRYRELRLQQLDSSDIEYLYVRSEIMREQGRGEEILSRLLQKCESPDTDLHQKAILNYITANIYRQAGDSLKVIYYYAVSAINDLSTPVNDYLSLRELATMLYRAGDIERAYSYITRSVQDAMVAQSRLNITSINSVLPTISASYDTLMQRKNRQLIYLLFGISILTVLLVLAASASITSRNRALIAEKKTREKNELLKKANDNLQKYISMLQEANQIKESYLSRYMDMCVEYIEGLERYRSQLRQTAKSGGFEKIMENLRSGNYIKKELQEFYSQFDSTFLSLFPDFVEQFNMLLKPECRIEDRSSEKVLSTELRVMALIRLGVHDSAKISRFLRRSISTVYNYRAKMRNSALSDRDDLEKQVMSIGRLSDLTTK